MRTTFESGLADLLMEDPSLRNGLRMQALALALGEDDSEDATISPDSRRSLSNEILDLTECRMNDVVRTCDTLAHDPGCASEQPGFGELLAECRELSELDAMICTILQQAPTRRPCAQMDRHGSSSQIKEMLAELQGWLFEIALNAKRLDEKINSEIKDVGCGYHTNVKLLDPSDVIEGSDGLDNMLKEYQILEVVPFIAPLDDFHFFVNSMFIRRFGRFDPSNRTMVALRTKIKWGAQRCACRADGVEQECVILTPEIGQALSAPYSSTDKRWLIDPDYLSSWTVNVLMGLTEGHLLE